MGKTALAERIIRNPKEKGYTVSAIKLSHHDPEPPTKDTRRLGKAGADKVLFYNGEIYILCTHTATCHDIDGDYIIVEELREKKVGYKIHIGADPPEDADLIVATPDAEVEVKCVE